MNNINLFLLFSIILLFSFGCNSEDRGPKAEDWVKLPRDEWPQIALTNTIEIADTTYTAIASSFLIDTGSDTLAVTAKHFFELFAVHGLYTVDFKGQLKSWKMFPKNNQDEIIEVGELINRNPSETAAIPGTSNNRDWLIFEIKDSNPDIYPLKIGSPSIRAGEYLYNLGWPMDVKSGPPKLYKFKVYRIVDMQIFMEPVEYTDNPAGLSGSPIFNSKGHVVAISSGGTGALARACSVGYLIRELEKHKGAE